MDSLKKRYFYKLLSNSIAIPIAFVIQMLVPRALGPEAYGSFSFLTNFFQQFVGFLDSGTSICFYTKITQRPKEKALIKFYFNYVFFASLLVPLFILVVLALKKATVVWPDQLIKYVFMGAIFGILTWASHVIRSIIDAYGLTKQGEIVNIIQKIISLIIIILLFFSSHLTLTTYFIHYYIILGVLIFGWFWILKSKSITLYSPEDICKKKNPYIKEFYSYSAPLFVVSVIGLLAGIFDRWLLQWFAGSQEQGYYGLAYQIASICFVFSVAMTPLITREFSAAYGESNMEKMKYLFRRYIPLFYTITAFFSVFLMLHAENLALIIGGKSFSGAIGAVAIMALYPMLQTYGQLSGSVFYATGKTIIYRNIGLLTSLFGIPVLWLLLAPKNLLGLELSSIGLSLKINILAYISVIIQLWFNCKFLNENFLKYFSHQIYVVLIFLVFGFSTKNLIQIFFNNLILDILLSGFLYTLLSAFIFWAFPKIVFLTKNERSQIMRSLLWKKLY